MGSRDGPCKGRSGYVGLERVGREASEEDRGSQVVHFIVFVRAKE